MQPHHNNNTHFTVVRTRPTDRTILLLRIMCPMLTCTTIITRRLCSVNRACDHCPSCVRYTVHTLARPIAQGSCTHLSVWRVSTKAENSICIQVTAPGHHHLSTRLPFAHVGNVCAQDGRVERGQLCRGGIYNLMSSPARPCRSCVRFVCARFVCLSPCITHTTRSSS